MVQHSQATLMFFRCRVQTTFQGVQITYLMFSHRFRKHAPFLTSRPAFWTVTTIWSSRECGRIGERRHTSAERAFPGGQLTARSIYELLYIGQLFWNGKMLKQSIEPFLRFSQRRKVEISLLVYLMLLAQRILYSSPTRAERCEM